MALQPSRLVDWLRVPTPMRAIRVRAWVEVVGSVMEFISFQSSMKCQKFSGATLREKRKARCPRMNSLAKYLALQYIRRYIAEFNEIECCSSQYSGKNRVTLTMKRIEAGRQFPMIILSFGNIVVNRGAVGESRTSGRRGKTPWGKLVSAINTVRKSQAASRWGPWKFRPSTAYDALLPHTRVQARVPGHWVGYILCCAWTPYLGWANEPRAE